MKEHNKDIHPSYGVMSISRISGGGQNFFGTELKPSAWVEMRLFQGEQHTNEFGELRIWPSSIAETVVRMTNSQFAEMITGLNVGMGTAVTISILEKKPIDKCPNQKRTIDLALHALQESEDESASYEQDRIDKWIKRIDEGKSLGKKELEELKKDLENSKFRYRSNHEFHKKQLNSQAEKLVAKIKTETDAIIGSKIMNLGLDVLNNPEAIKLLEKK